MDVQSFLQLLENAALLIAMVFVFDLAIGSYKNVHKLKLQIISGIALGGICVILMLVPLQLSSGLIFDSRSVMLGLTGLFFSYLTTFIVIIMAVIARIMIGGIGALTGILVIIVSAGLGMVFQKIKTRGLGEYAWYEFYLFGIVVNGVFLVLLMFTTPTPVAFDEEP